MIPILVSIIITTTTIGFLLHKLVPRLDFTKPGRGSCLGLLQAAGAQHAVLGGIDIVFVHGLASNPETTWKAYSPDLARKIRNSSPFATSPPKDVCWVTDFLPDDLKQRGRRKDRIFFYNYDSSWMRDAVRVQSRDLAEQLLTVIQKAIRQDQSRRLLFVCHSYGGIITKRALVHAIEQPRFKNIAHSTRGVVFLGTPHRGSRSSIFGKCIAYCLQSFGADWSTLTELSDRSPTLLDLDLRFTHLLKQLNISVFSAYETKATVTGIDPISFRQWPAPKESAEVLEPRDLVRNVALPLDHKSLNKFGERDNSYRIVFGGIEEILNPETADVCMMPYPRITSYSERKVLAQSLDDILIAPASRNSNLQVAVVHGLGGTGKTQLVLDFITRHQKEFNPVLWIDAQSPETIRNSFQRCAHALELDLRASPQPSNSIRDFAPVSATMRLLAEKDGEDKQWLLIFDNANDEDPGLIQQVMPSANFGNVIVIGQHYHIHTFPSNYPRLEVSILEEDEAADILLKRLNMPVGLCITEDAEIRISQINRRLGYLALTVDLAGAYIFQEHFDGKSPTDSASLEAALMRYLDDLEIHQNEMLEWPTLHSNYEKNAASVWRMTLKAIDAKYPNFVSSFFKLIATFDRTSIDEDLFRQACHGFWSLHKRQALPMGSMPDWLILLVKTQPNSQVWDSFYVNRATRVCARYGLLQLRESKGSSTTVEISMHSIVQRYTNGTDGQLQKSCLLWFFASAAYALKKSSAADSDSAHHFLRHLSVTIHTFPSIQGSHERLQREIFMPWHIMAQLIKRENRSTLACKLLRELLDVSERIWGSHDPTTLDLMIDLASIHMKNNDLKESFTLYNTAYESCVTLYGVDHPQTWDAMSGIGTVFMKQKRWARSFKVFIDIFTMMEERYGLNHKETIWALGTTALNGLMLGKYDFAQETWSTLHELQTHQLGSDHDDTIYFKHMLGYTLSCQGKHLEAVAVEREVYDILSKTLPEGHQRLLDSGGAIADYYEAGGLDQQAEEVRRSTEESFNRRLKRLHWTSDHI